MKKVTGEMIMAQANAHYQSIVVERAKKRGMDLSYQPPEVLGTIQSRQVEALARAMADFLNLEPLKKPSKKNQ